jgi:hypothetical protein
MMKFRIMGGVGHVARVGQKRNAYSILVGKPDRKRRLAYVGDNIKVDFGEIDWRNMSFVRLARDRDRSCAVVKK